MDICSVTLNLLLLSGPPLALSGQWELQATVSLRMARVSDLAVRVEHLLGFTCGPGEQEHAGGTCAWLPSGAQLTADTPAPNTAAVMVAGRGGGSC